MQLYWIGAEEELSQPVAWVSFLLFTLLEDFDWQSLRSVAMMIVMMLVTKRMYAMHVYIVNSSYGAGIYIDTFPGNLFHPQNVIITFVCCQILIRIPKHFFRCAAECVWCLRWVGATLHCLSAAKTRLCAAPQPGMRCGNARSGWTSQVRHRLLSSRSPASSSSWPTNKEVTSSNKLRRTQAGGVCSSGSEAKQTWLSATKPSPVKQM